MSNSNNNFGNQLGNFTFDFTNHSQSKNSEILKKLNTFTPRYGEELGLEKGFKIYKGTSYTYGPWPERWFIASFTTESNPTRGGDQQSYTHVIDNHGQIHKKSPIADRNSRYEAPIGFQDRKFIGPSKYLLSPPLPDFAIDAIKKSINEYSNPAQTAADTAKHMINSLMEEKKGGRRKTRRNKKG